MVRENLGTGDVCKDADISIVISQGYTCYEPQKITMVQVSDGVGANVTGLRFVVGSEGNSVEYNDQKVAYSANNY